MSEQEKAWKQQPLSDIFRIGREQILPSQQPKAIFIHYSIPAWDEFGGPAFDLGETIESNKTAISEPSVLVSKLNPRKPRVVVIEAPERRTCCSTEFICYQPWRTSENLRFWGMYLYSQEFSARLARVAIGSTNSHTRASPRETLDWLVPSVPIIEQGAIAQVLDILDTTIRETKALIDKLKAVKQGLLHDLLTRGIDANGQLRPPQSEAPQLYRESPSGWIPREWELRELGKLAEISRGKFTHRPRNDPAFFGGEYPFIQTGDVALAQGGYIYSYSQTLSKRGISVSQEFPAGTIAITIAANIADTAILACPMFFPDSIVGAVVAPEHNIRFVELSIRRAKRTLDARAPQSAQKNINLQDLRPLLLAVPNRIEQDAIAARYDAIQAQLEAEQIAVNKLYQKKFALMDDLLTGRVRVTPLLESIQQAATPTGD